MFPYVSPRGGAKWPSSSPDLSICDFFVCGRPEENVFKNRKNSKNRIRREEIAAATPVETREHAAENFRNPLLADRRRRPSSFRRRFRNFYANKTARLSPDKIKWMWFRWVFFFFFRFVLTLFSIAFQNGTLFVFRRTPYYYFFYYPPSAINVMGNLIKAIIIIPVLLYCTCTLTFYRFLLGYNKP